MVESMKKLKGPPAVSPSAFAIMNRAMSSAFKVIVIDGPSACG
jgi:hypothetical protein